MNSLKTATINNIAYIYVHYYSIYFSPFLQNITVSKKNEIKSLDYRNP